MKVRIINWTPAHAARLTQSRAALLADVSPRMESRQGIAIDFDAFPLYGDIGGCLVLDAAGTLGLIEFHSDRELRNDAFVNNAEAQEWFEFAWARSGQTCPDLLDGLKYVIG